jgi:hypothetical protein
MAFLRRLLFYLIGVGLGIGLWYMFFGDRDLDFCYSPSCRTKKIFRTKTLDSNSLTHEVLDLSKDSLYYKAIVDGTLYYTNPWKDDCHGEWDIVYNYQSHDYRITLEYYRGYDPKCEERELVRVLDVQITD